jgi:hypothetical protein
MVGKATTTALFQGEHKAMAQQLHPITLIPNHPIVTLRTPSGRSGYNQGMKRLYRANVPLPDVVDEESAVTIIRNLVEMACDGELSESLLRQDTMRLVAWVLSIAQ